MQPPSHFTSRRQQKIWENQQRENAAKQLKKESYVNQSPFRYAERHFRSRHPPLDMTLVADCHSGDPALTEVQLAGDLRALHSVFGAADDAWHARAHQAYTVKNIPGLIVIPNPFTQEAQRQLAKKCLAEYSQAPHTCNLHTDYEVPQQGVWPLHMLEQQGQLCPDDPDFYIPPREKSDEDGKDGLYDSDEPRSVAKLTPTELLLKLRWVTLGCQFLWGTRSYDLGRVYPIPEDIDAATRAIVCAVEGIGAEGWQNTYKGSDFKSEAGVINYYQLRNTLMAHVDDSELNMDAPLVSISLGHSCIFLIGGPTRDTAPVPLLLRSGDIIVMTGACRKAYHGVPRILEDSLPDFLAPEGSFADAPDWPLFGTYLSKARININVRQVFPCQP